MCPYRECSPTRKGLVTITPIGTSLRDRRDRRDTGMRESDRNNDTSGIIKRLRAARAPSNTKGMVTLRPCRTYGSFPHNNSGHQSVSSPQSSCSVLAVGCCHRHFFVVFYFVLFLLWGILSRQTESLEPVSCDDRLFFFGDTLL